MSVFRDNDYDFHEQVVFASDRETGLKAIIAVHNSSQGPGLGGCRIWNYENSLVALNDVLRLSRGMTYKSALAELPFGGGKSVIIADQKNKTPALMKAMAQAVERLSGRYIIAEDVGSTLEDMDIIHEHTKHVVGLRESMNGSGDPSPATAFGVYNGIVASIDYKLRRNTLQGLKVAVQGLGAVGYKLCQRLHNDGAILYVSDINQEMVDKVVKEFGAVAVTGDEIFGLDVDLFVPCALGAILNDKTIPMIKAKVIAGAANNQLAEQRHGQLLRDKGILYAPDYAINAGGVINVSFEYNQHHKYNHDEAYKKIANIQETMLKIYRKADADNIPTNIAADRIVEEKLKLKR